MTIFLIVPVPDKSYYPEELEGGLKGIWLKSLSYR